MPKKKLVTASQIYNELLNKFKIKEKIGSVEIKLGNISAKYNGKDAIGDLLQEWLGEWLKSKNYYFRTRENTQAFPDFLLSESDTINFLELKTFNANANPTFDIANFDSYCTSLLELPERIEADYLIFGYKMIDAELTIDNLWLKKVWELTSPSGKDAIKIQRKRGQIYNIRPCIWYSNRLKFLPFNDKNAFLEAISETIEKNPQCEKYRKNWLKKVKKNYYNNTGIKL